MNDPKPIDLEKIKEEWAKIWDIIFARELEPEETIQPETTNQETKEN